MKFLLAIDTSTPETMVAIGTPPPGAMVALTLKERPKSHGPALLPLMDRALAEVGTRPQDLAAIGVGIGPGSFTGVRIGLATAKALAYATGVPLVTVDWFELLAKSFPEERIAVVMDAKRDEVFYALYEKGERVQAPVLATRDEFFEAVPPDGGWVLVGPWVESRLEDLTERYGVDAIAPEEYHRQTPEALFEGVALRMERGEFSPLDAEPLYLREPDAVVNLRRRLAKEGTDG